MLLMYAIANYIGTEIIDWKNWVVAGYFEHGSEPKQEKNIPTTWVGGPLLERTFCHGMFWLFEVQEE